jgi:hypothetical protein
MKKGGKRLDGMLQILYLKYSVQVDIISGYFGGATSLLQVLITYQSTRK